MTASAQTEEILRMMAEDKDHVDCIENDSNEVASNRTRVIKASEIGIYKDLGLGLGVDATDPTPWTNRKPFRARNVTFKDVFGMTEGKLHSFSEEVMSIREFQSCVKASVPADQPIRVGINTEASWSYSVQKRSIGKKIISRIVTFKSRFEDVPICEAVEPDSGELSFESQLTDFIQKRTNNTSVESLNPETLTNHCFQFIKNSAVTHYVHRIELGACHYRTISEEEYNTMFGANTKMGVDEIAEIALNNKAEFKSYRFQSEVVEIGQLRERDSDQNEEVRDQKVVGVEFKSIISLVVKSEKLRKAMQEALSKYIVMREDCKYGPFHISCDGGLRNLFLKVESNNQLKTTNEPDDASQFLIVRCEQQKEYFKIVYQPPVTENGNPGPVPSLFLSASNDDKPLLMKNTVNKSKLALRSRDAEHFDPDHPAKLSSWVSGTGKEFCYICCTEVPKKKRNRRRRYLCIFKPRADGLEETDYITGCKSRKDHDKPDKMKHMLFSLIKSCKTTNQDESKASKDKISEGDPFFITTNFDGSDENVYFKVDEGCNIHATTRRSEASQFYIKPEQGNLLFTVNFYETKSGSKRTGGDNVGHMTQFSTNSLGYSSRNCPLQLQHRDTNSHSDYGVLSICKQKPQLTDSEEVEMVDPEQWFQDGIYISYSAECDETSGKSSYLCVQKKARCWRRNVTYSTGCVSSIQHHNGQEISMLFKLVRASGSGVQTGESQNRPRSERRVVIDGEITALLNEGQETD